MPHDLKGQGVAAYVILKSGEEATEMLKGEINPPVFAVKLASIANLDSLYLQDALPKTRSGKIMRRIQ